MKFIAALCGGAAELGVRSAAEGIRMAKAHLLVLLLVCGMGVLAGCNEPDSPNPESGKFATAANTNESRKARLLAADGLGASERLRLQQMLLNRLPGNWDKATLDDIELLALIGDKNCLQKLENMYNTKEVVNGKILTAIDHAVQDIKKRDIITYK